MNVAAKSVMSLNVTLNKTKPVKGMAEDPLHRMGLKEEDKEPRHSITCRTMLSGAEIRISVLSVLTCKYYTVFY